MFCYPGVHVQYGACAHVILAALFVRTLLLPGLWIDRFRGSAGTLVFLRLANCFQCQFQASWPDKVNVNPTSTTRRIGSERLTNVSWERRLSCSGSLSVAIADVERCVVKGDSVFRTVAAAHITHRSKVGKISGVGNRFLCVVRES